MVEARTLCLGSPSIHADHSTDSVSPCWHTALVLTIESGHQGGLPNLPGSKRGCIVDNSSAKMHTGICVRHPAENILSCDYSRFQEITGTGFGDNWLL
jgi:hypothetical protein